jgi:phospholipase C
MGFERATPRTTGEVRRRLAAGGVALALIAGACDAEPATGRHPSPSGAPGSTSIAPPTTSPVPPAQAGGGDTTRWPIKHVVFLIKENRTFDNLFGRSPARTG